MKEKNRVFDFANYILDNEATIRQTAKYFGFSKSTVHNDIQKKLKKVDKSLYEKVVKILIKNFEQKHIRGGQSTKEKYEKIREKLS